MILYSMTGFGEDRANIGDVAIGVEMRSVNHRFLDISTKIPQAYSKFEGEITKLIRGALKRGRVDVFITRNETGAGAGVPQFHEAAFMQLVELTKRAATIAGVPEKAAVAAALPNLLMRREVLESQSGEVDADAEWKVLEKLVGGALKNLLSMRGTEGASLKKDLEEHLKLLSASALKIEEISSKTPLQFQERLKVKIEKLLASSSTELDPARLAQEVALFADRVDVSEEIVRLKSHLEQFHQVLRDGEGGRKLEFLLQELVREINTAGSKSQNADIAVIVIEAKATVEKMREQVLNLE